MDDAGDAIDRVEAAWRRERPDVDVSSVGIVSRSWRISRHLEQARKERLAEHGTDRVTLDVLTGAQIGQYREDAPVGIVGVRDIELAQ